MPGRSRSKDTGAYMELFDYEKKHLEMLRPHLAECTVLLKTDGSFPLDAPCRIAAYGSGVRRTVKGGTGSGEVNSRFFTNVEEGLLDAGFILTTGEWLDAYETAYAASRKQFFTDLKAEAKKAKVNVMIYGMGRVMPEPEYDIPLDADGDAAIYVVSRISGEGSDRRPVRGDLLLSASEERDILALSARFEKFMLVINAGGPIDLTGIADRVGNILVLSQLGVETGAALADVLLGRENPSGKLTTTWSAWNDYAKLGTFGGHDDTRYNEGIYVGYRYFDAAGKKALFPFGYGLSYTTFDTSPQSASLSGTEMQAAVLVTNTGKYSGREVVQLYVSSPSGALDKPKKALAGFGKTASLAPGGSETVTVSFDLRDLASYDERNAAYILEAGDYIVRAGTSSEDTKICAVISLNATSFTKKVRNALGRPDFTDWKPEGAPAEEIPEGVPHFELSASSIVTETFDYDRRDEIDDAVRALSNDKLIYANIGNFDPKGGVLSVIGNAAKELAGAAGETTAMLKDAGFPVLEMADGPAGLRLSKEFYRDKTGAHTIGGSALPESMAELLPVPVQKLLALTAGKTKVPKGAVRKTQYCTAIPIGTAIAQSWNTDFAELCGDIVGEEMERFGVHLWLAPALNIHRSVLCGRNFEYFSEDPLVSGLFAAAITEGVQKHPGRGVTIKHYAANNQEFNRYGSSSNVSERAMREIYLRGFEICIRKASPAAVMSSYNLLNGVHTAERRDLCTDILRTEFGFEGVLMTDWVISLMSDKKDVYPVVKPRLVAAAGGDLFMPGAPANYKDMMAGIIEGSLTRQDLLVNATRVYRLGKKLMQTD